MTDVKAADTGEPVNIPDHLLPILENAVAHSKAGGQVFFKWSCTHCGARQTFEEEITFHLRGRCEECQGVTELFDPKADVNFVVVATLAKPPAASAIDGAHRAAAAKRGKPQGHSE